MVLGAGPLPPVTAAERALRPVPAWGGGLELKNWPTNGISV